MRKRNGFVSNSSGSNFIIATKNLSEEMICELMGTDNLDEPSLGYIILEEFEKYLTRCSKLKNKNIDEQELEDMNIPKNIRKETKEKGYKIYQSFIDPTDDGISGFFHYFKKDTIYRNDRIIIYKHSNLF